MKPRWVSYLNFTATICGWSPELWSARRSGSGSTPRTWCRRPFSRPIAISPGFLGSTEPELTAWLRQILVRTVANQAKHHRRQGRDYQKRRVRWRSCSTAPARQSTAPWPRPVPRPASTRSGASNAVLLADALEKLPADYREVFILRNLEHIPFDEIAIRMDRSPGAARVLWKRAIKRLASRWRRTAS